MIRHHPPLELLCEYAAGCLDEGSALAIATHASLCRQCADAVATFEAVGGALLEEEAAIDVAPASLQACLARLEEQEPVSAPQPVFDVETLATVPSPLRGYLTDSLQRLPWRRVGSLFEEVRLPLRAAGVKASLMRLKSGTAVPLHSHRGIELTVVLAGGFTDHGVNYARGDLAIGDPSSEHRPVADDDGGCLCLAVLDAPVRLLGVMGRLVNPFLRI